MNALFTKLLKAPLNNHQRGRCNSANTLNTNSKAIRVNFSLGGVTGLLVHSIPSLSLCQKLECWLQSFVNEDNQLRIYG